MSMEAIIWILKSSNVNKFWKFKLVKICFLSILMLVTIGSNSNAFGWSWKDLKVGITTEGEVIAFGGKPWEVVLSFDDYLHLQTGSSRNRPLVEFKYKVNTASAKYISEKGWRIPVILEKAPLGLSDEIWEIELSIFFVDGKLQRFHYKFGFKSKPDGKKYIDLLSSLLGSPITITENDLVGVRSTHIEYKNDYKVMFMDGLREPDSIYLFLPY